MNADKTGIAFIDRLILLSRMQISPIYSKELETWNSGGNINVQFKSCFKRFRDGKLLE